MHCETWRKMSRVSKKRDNAERKADEKNEKQMLNENEKTQPATEQK